MARGFLFSLPVPVSRYFLFSLLSNNVVFATYVVFARWYRCVAQRHLPLPDILPRSLGGPGSSDGDGEEEQHQPKGSKARREAEQVVLLGEHTALGHGVTLYVKITLSTVYITLEAWWGFLLRPRWWESGVIRSNMLAFGLSFACPVRWAVLPDDGAPAAYLVIGPQRSSQVWRHACALRRRVRRTSRCLPGGRLSYESIRRLSGSGKSRRRPSTSRLHRRSARSGTQ